MDFLREEITDLPFSSTLFFPVSADPIGFNHFAAAEAMLRRHAQLRHVVLIPSNGFHPDPTKADPEISAQQRVEVLLTAVEALADPERCQLARLAAAAGDALQLAPERIVVWPQELTYSRAVRSIELVEQVRAARPRDSAPLFWFAGSDLVSRMSDPKIFSGEDLTYLAQSCTYLILEREEFPLARGVQTLFQTRQVDLRHEGTKFDDLPAWLTLFLALSSTRIREAAQAGDPLGAMLPHPAAEIVSSQGWYRRPPEETTPLRERLAGLQRQLETEAAGLLDWLAGRVDAGLPGRVSVAEASVGGWLTVALAGRTGASRHLAQTRFAYDRQAKETLLAGREGPKFDISASAVTTEMAAALAQGIRDQSGADYGLAETGMAGPPDGKRRSMKSGQCHIALATLETIHTASLELNPFLTRKEHQLTFALVALRWAREWLTEGEE